MARIWVLLLLFLSVPLLAAAPTAVAAPTEDPLGSPLWRELAERYFGDAPVVFDDRVRVVVPVVVENQAQVPVAVDARGISSIEKLIVFADWNPIQHVLTLKPVSAAPYVAFRMKVEQGTPIRAAALAGGVWHVGGVYLDAVGGGCSAPAVARKQSDWYKTVGQTQGRLWREKDDWARARFRIRHPMDTGLAKEEPIAFFVERIDVKDADGAPLASLETFQPFSEDPTLTLLLRPADTSQPIVIEGRDNKGLRIRASLAAPAKQSWLAGHGSAE